MHTLVRVFPGEQCVMSIPWPRFTHFTCFRRYAVWKEGCSLVCWQSAMRTYPRCWLLLLHPGSQSPISLEIIETESPVSRQAPPTCSMKQTELSSPDLARPMSMRTESTVPRSVWPFPLLALEDERRFSPLVCSVEAFGIH